MKTRILSLIIIFTALAVVLNIYGPKIPYPLYPFLWFQLWEIPIVAAFLMAGPRSGVIVATINTFLLLAVFPGGLPTGPLYNFVAILSMFLGMYLPYWYAKRQCKTENFGVYLRRNLIFFSVTAVTLGTLLRVFLLTAVNYFALQQTYPIGFSMPVEAVLVFLPLGAIFNAIVALYTIPIAILIAAVIMSRTKLQ